MDDEVQGELERILERGRRVELMLHKMANDIPLATGGIWSQHFAAVNLLVQLASVLAEGTSVEQMTGHILEAYEPYAKPYLHEKHPKFD